MARNIDPAVEEVLNAITDTYGIPQNAVEFGGGGKGQTATTTSGIILTGRGSSRLAAARDLQRQVAEVYATAPDGDVEGDFEGMTEGEAERCVAECMTSQSDYCECKCDGANHGATSGRKTPAIRLGRKTCACGCGLETQRRFVPGHDARFHAAEKAREAGFETVEAWRVEMRKSRNERAATKRREKRAAIKAGADRIAAAAKAGTLVPGSKPSPKGDDLPF